MSRKFRRLRSILGILGKGLVGGEVVEVVEFRVVLLGFLERLCRSLEDS